jgi:23S rRNA pseudouridine2605 synthase
VINFDDYSRHDGLGLADLVRLGSLEVAAEGGAQAGPGLGKALLELVMTEGRKREVRRMLAEVGLPVERLARVAFGGVELGDLRQGKWRFLNSTEVAKLHAASGGSSAATAKREARPATSAQVAEGQAQRDRMMGSEPEDEGTEG